MVLALGRPPKKQKGAARQVLWVEKYRPRSLAQVSSQEHAVHVLKKALQSANLPHMLFYGPPGTGKTSTILALAKELFGPELMSRRVLELNASDERGISIIREKVKNFAKTSITNEGNANAPPYKIIILDEADSMTQDAQSALRRTMETYSKTTRFCLICNYVTRIIEPLASRCSKFRFKPLDDTNARERLEHIAKAEHVAYDADVIPALLDAAEGDLRKAITYMQSASQLHQAEASLEDDGMAVDGAGTSDRITAQTIVDIAGVVPGTVVRELLAACQPGQGGGALDSAKIVACVQDIVCEGYATEQILSQLHDVILLDEVVDARQKSAIFLKMSEIDKRLTDGADEHVQLLDMAMTIAQTLVSA